MKTRRIFLYTLMVMSAITIQAQNVQFHYDLGHSLYHDLSTRPKTTTTVEMFKADRWGSNYLFIDIDYFGDGVAGAYWEISREINLTRNKRWAFHLEYNGGATSIKNTNIASRYQHAILSGGAWNWNSSDYSKTLSVQAMYTCFQGPRRLFSSA